jgi:hypothetical protein
VVVAKATHAIATSVLFCDLETLEGSGPFSFLRSRLPKMIE